MMHWSDPPVAIIFSGLIILRTSLQIGMRLPSGIKIPRRRIRSISFPFGTPKKSIPKYGNRLMVQRTLGPDVHTFAAKDAGNNLSILLLLLAEAPPQCWAILIQQTAGRR